MLSDDGHHRRDHGAARVAGGAHHAAEDGGDHGGTGTASSGAGSRCPRPRRWPTRRSAASGGRRQERRRRRHGRQQGGDEHRGRDRGVHLVPSPRAVGPRDQDADRGAEGPQREDQDEDQAVGEADRRDGGRAEAPTTTWLTKLSTSISTNSRLTGTAIRAISRRGDGAPPAGRPACPEGAARSGCRDGARSRPSSSGREAGGDGMGVSFTVRRRRGWGRRSRPRARGLAPTANQG